MSRVFEPPADAVREAVRRALADELARGSLIGADGVVTHIGADPSGDPLAAARRVGEAIAEAFDRAGAPDCDTRLLLENTAGAGRTFGATFEEIAAAIESMDAGPRERDVAAVRAYSFLGAPLDPYLLKTIEDDDERRFRLGFHAGSPHEEHRNGDRRRDHGLRA